MIGPELGLSHGVLWLFFACLGWSGASVWESRAACPAGPLSTAAVQMCVGGVGLAILALVCGEPAPIVDAQGLLGWLWLTLICAVIGMPGWLWLLRVLPMSTAMLQATLSPMFAAWLGWFLLGERWSLAGQLGVAGVLFGAWLTVSGSTEGRMHSSPTTSPPASPSC